MLIKNKPELTYADVTPKNLYFSRRNFLRGLSIAGAATLVGERFASILSHPGSIQANSKLATVKSKYTVDEKVTSENDVTHYNNFYEFGTDKGDPAKNAQNFPTSPWAVSVEGDVKTPRKFSMDEILKLAPLEERIYRHRCVERWSIVVPWIGYSLSTILKSVEPLPKAKYLAFQTFYDAKQMPRSFNPGLHYPYVKRLRLDEAMHPLALLCVGLYGEVLPNQNGAPVRLVVPWKYGYKSIKSIARIRFVEKQPATTWSLAVPSVYGFYSNVNPEVDPLWSQATERRLGDFFKRKTLKFNGYAEQVATLYDGMDLRKNF